jgi:cytosine/creatinine deaminase
MADLLIQRARLGDRPDPVDVLVRDGVVHSVADDVTPAEGAEVVDAGGRLVLPGLVEAHCHLDKTLFGREWVPHAAADTLADRIATDFNRRTELGIPDPQAMAALVQAMSVCGTTTIRTHTDVDPQVGLRGVELVAELAVRSAGSVDIQQVAFPQHGLLSRAGTADLLDAALRSGASVVGGLDPGAEGDADAYLDAVFGIAEKHAAMVDLHLHTGGADGLAEVDLVVERTKALGMAGRVVLSHVYALGTADADTARAVADRLAGAGVGVVTAAPYSYPVPDLRVLHEAGVVVGIGHDGIRDLWGPYGTGDLLERACHVAYRSHFRRDDEIELVLAAAITGGRQLLGIDPVGVRPGDPADLVLVPAGTRAEAVVAHLPGRVVIKGGRVITSTLPGDESA